MELFGNLGKKKTGVLPYVLLLILAIIVLFFISYTSFQQNRALRQSTEQVSHTQEVIGEINTLFGSYAGAESAGIKYLISRDSRYLSPLVGYKDKGKLSLKRLMKLTSDSQGQQELLKRVPDLSVILFKELQSLDPEIAKTVASSQALSDKIYTIERQRDSLEQIKDRITAAQYDLLEQRKTIYRSEVTLTPINILYLALFTLGILMFAFSKINSDRKKMTATREFLHSILESTDNIIIYLAPVRDDHNTIIDFEVAYVNSQVDQVIGDAVKETNNKKLSEIYPFVVKKGLMALLIDVLKTGETKTRETDYDIDGSETWFVSTFAPMNDGITVTSRNITTSKKADEALKKLNEKLEVQNLDLESTGAFLKNMLGSIQYVVSYFEAVRDATGQIVDFKIVYTNDKISELTSRTPAEIAGKMISEECPFLFENGDFETYLEVIASGEPKEVEKEYHLCEGRFYFCNEILKLGDGVTIVSQDVSMRKEAERKLETANNRLALQNMVLSDAELVAGMGSYSCNLSKETLTFSDNCFRLLGLEPSQDIPSVRLINSLIHPNDRNRFKRYLSRTLSEKENVSNVYRIRTKDGIEKNVVMQGHFFEKNEENFMVGALRDITKEVNNELTLQKRNRELESSNAELESFNRVVSHDLQEPLRKIQMFISRLTPDDTKNLSEQGQNYLAKIDGSANRMQLLIRNLLSYSRIAYDIEALQKTDLNYILEKVLEDLSEKIQETHAKIDIPELPKIYGSEFQLEQLFNNLLSNSIKYKRHDRSPEIMFTSEILPFHKIDKKLHLARSKYVFLTLTDNGVGFDANQSEKIFGLFQRLHKKHAYEGTGLGLAICKKIVENHEGHISAHSEPGKGTRIEIYLPFREQR